MAPLKNFMDSHAYFQDDVTWCVQKAKGHAKWKQILLIADWKIFLCIFGSVIPITVLTYAFTTFEKHPLDIWSSAFLVVRTISTTPSTLNPERHSARFLYSMFLCSCFFLTSLFVSYMFAIISQPLHDHQIFSFGEIVNANFRLAAEEAMGNFLIDRNMVKNQDFPFYKFRG